MTDTKRRVFLQGSVAASLIGVAAGAGLLTPQAVLAAYPKDAFAAKDEASAISSLLGSDTSEASDAVTIKAPDIAENGAVVPVTIETSLEQVESISLLSASNATPLVASYSLAANTSGYVSNRIKMGKTGDVIALVKAGGKVYSQRKSVKVTVGGCGG
jgi:sulfur-oxidizing protein SoxY